MLFRSPESIVCYISKLGCEKKKERAEKTGIESKKSHERSHEDEV